MLISLVLAVTAASTSSFECGLSANPQHDQIWRPLRGNARKSAISKKIRVFIVGGTAAPPDAWPWHALIKYRSLINGKLYVCGGSLISENYILTAAHCATDMSVDHTLVSIGTVRSKDQSPEATYNVVKKFVHPKYVDDMEINPRQLHDIAVLQLASPATLSQHQRPICLAPPPNDFSNISAYVIGFGAYNIGVNIGKNLSQYLQQTTVPLINKELCSQRWRRLKDYGGGFDIAPTQICAGSLGHGSAQGDSGGPLMLRNSNGRWYQIGITSFGINDGPGYYDQNMAPGIYTRISSYCDFIKSSTEGEVLCDSVECQLKIFALSLWLLLHLF